MDDEPGVGDATNVGHHERTQQAHANTAVTLCFPTRVRQARTGHARYTRARTYQVGRFGRNWGRLQGAASQHQPPRVQALATCQASLGTVRQQMPTRQHTEHHAVPVPLDTARAPLTACAALYACSLAVGTRTANPPKRRADNTQASARGEWGGRFHRRRHNPTCGNSLLAKVVMPRR